MKIYCYSKCSTCQKALKYLKDKNISFEEIDIKNNPPSYEELLDYFKISNLPVKKFVNTSGLLYKELNLKDKLPTMKDEEVLKLISTNGMLIKRPLLINNNQILLGFKEDEYKKIEL